jgi:HK97 family phage portal protein
MKFSESLKNIFKPSYWKEETFKADMQKSMLGFTNERAAFMPQFTFSRPDEFINSGDYRGLVDGPNSSSNFVELFHCVPEIFAPIHAIASRIANADFQLRRTFNDQVQYKDADWNRLFNTPNPLQHFRELIYEAVVYEYVTGNEYMLFNTPSAVGYKYQNVSSIWNLPADKIEPVKNSSLKLFTATTIEDLVSKYKLDDKNLYEPKDVLHIRAINLDWEQRKIKGKSPLLSAKKAIANLIAVYEARNVIYTKRGALGFIVSRKSDESGMQSLTAKEKDGIYNEFNGNYGITNNRTPIGITEAPIDYVKVGATISELQPFEETLADAMAIYSALQVPRELMPMKDGATFENQKQADRGFYQNVIMPKAANMMQSLTNKLGLNEAKLYLHASFDHIDVLQENKKEKAEVDKTNTETYRQRFINGVCSLNDWVVSTGNEKVTAIPLYDKRVYEMEPEELAKVKEVLSMKTMAQPNTNADGTANDGSTAS